MSKADHLTHTDLCKLRKLLSRKWQLICRRLRQKEKADSAGGGAEAVGEGGDERGGNGRILTRAH